jgi:hypothetical protein
MKKVSILGVLVGSVTDVSTSFILGIPFGIYALSKVDLAHTPKDQLQSAITAAMHANAMLYWAQLSVGLFCSILGGFVAASIAKRMELLNGALSSFLCVGLGIFTVIAGKGFDPIIVQILLLISSPLMGLLGGYLRFLQIRSTPRLNT